MGKRIYKKLKETGRHFFLFTLGSMIRPFIAPSFPKNPDGKVLIHIGCGDQNDPRYINMDMRSGLHVHVIDSIKNIDKAFPPSYADLIYACHVLEHVPYASVPGVLKKTWRCLKKDGILRLSVPNFAVIVDMYEKKHAMGDILPPLMGGQGYPDNFHSAAFDEQYLKDKLSEAGFRKIKKWDPQTAPYHTFDDWAGRTIDLYGKKWPISLNLEAIK